MKPMPDLDPLNVYMRQMASRKLILATRQLAGYLGVPLTAVYTMTSESYGQSKLKASDWV